MKQCSKCKEWKEEIKFNKRKERNGLRSECKICQSQNAKNYYIINKKSLKIFSSKEKKSNENQRLNRIYNITMEDYNNMYNNQNGKCLICEESFEKLCIDHDHKTGKVRGLLCRNCNGGIGLLKENIHIIKNSLNYLK